MSVTCYFSRRYEELTDSYPSYTWSEYLVIDAFSVQDRMVSEVLVGSSSDMMETTTVVYFSSIFDNYDSESLRDVRPGDRVVIGDNIFSVSSGAKTVTSPWSCERTTSIIVKHIKGVSNGNLQN